MLNRRHLFAVVPAAVIASALPAISAIAFDLDAECTELNRISGALNLADDAVYDAYFDRQKRFLDAVEALPQTPENNRIRARAVMHLYGGDRELTPMENLIESLLDQQTTDQRLICQILVSLTGAH